MIFVTVGTHNQGFDRLIRAMDEIAAECEERVAMQTGVADYVPKHAEHFQFSNSRRIEELIREARVVVSHAGVASILIALKYGKPLIVVPRLKKYNEVRDDHQQELAEALANEGKVQIVSDISKLVEALGKVSKTELKGQVESHRDKLVEALRREIAAFYISNYQK